ncbi:hypothetical protein C8F01DRAFT_1301401 [Mycena amicta]|nr:hypothetical protein C8F01DRAFT_1301401 [Mycena amicta]
MTSLPPVLPPDLEREIFELVALAMPQMLPSLLHVAHRVHLWTEPLLWRTIQITPRHPANITAFLDVARHKSAAFLAQHVKRVIVQYPRLTPRKTELNVILHLLRSCTGIQRLAVTVYHPPFHVELLSIIQTFVGIQRLTLELEYLFPGYSIGIARPQLPFFSTITHLDTNDEIDSDEPDDIEGFIARLQLFPALTHVALNNMDPFNLRTLLATPFPHLAVVVDLMAINGYVMTLGQGPPVELDDPEWQLHDVDAEMRVVVTWARNWGEGVADAPTIWTIAESFLQQKRKGEISDGHYNSEGHSGASASAFPLPPHHIAQPSTSSPMSMPSLHWPIIAAALRLCDAFTVLSVSQVSKDFHKLAMDAKLWRSIIRELYRRNFIDRHAFVPGLGGKVTADLIDIVRRIHIGPKSFLRSSSECSPNIPSALRSNSTLLQPYSQTVVTLTPSVVDDAKPRRAVLLPRGKYILLANDTVLECIRVSDSAVIWRSSCEEIQVKWAARTSPRFTFELLEGGTTLNLALYKPETGLIGVLCLNLSSGHSKILFVAGLNGMFMLPTSHISMAGHYVALEMRAYDNRGVDEPRPFILVIDWFRLRYCMLGHSDAFWSNFNLVPGSPHFVCTTSLWNDKSSGASAPVLRVELRAIDALRPSWTDSTTVEIKFNSEDVVNLAHVPCLLSHSDIAGTLRSSSCPPEIESCVFPSPISDETFRLWVSLHSMFRDESDSRGTCLHQLVGYRLMVPCENTPQNLPDLAMRITLDSSGHLDESQYISYAGSRLRRRAQQGNMFIAVARSGPVRRDDPLWVKAQEIRLRPSLNWDLEEADASPRIQHGVESAHMSVWSGALTYVSRGRILVQYFT